EQIKTNLSQCIFVSLKHVLAIVLVLSVCRSIYSYVFAFFLITFLEWFCNSTIIIRKIGFCLPSWINIKKIILRNYKLSVGILLGVFSSQIDRLFMSRYLSIQSFGIYVMVVQFGLALLQLQYPMVKAIMPHIAKFGNESKLGTYKFIAFVFVAIPSIIIFLWTRDILWIWSHNIEVVNQGEVIVKILSLAVLINFFYNFIHVKLVVESRANVIILSQACVVVINALFLMFFTETLHEIAGAISWVMNFIIVLTCGLLFYHRRK
ncbi:TPA: polysaccharide biosynthesis family protein, partial [Escherichia coli]|nr:polysaccharide biosynthesis family protein [Escherichia coli]